MRIVAVTSVWILSGVCLHLGCLPRPDTFSLGVYKLSFLPRLGSFSLTWTEILMQTAEMDIVTDYIMMMFFSLLLLPSLLVSLLA